MDVPGPEITSKTLEKIRRRLVVANREGKPLANNATNNELAWLHWCCGLSSSTTYYVLLR
jgi:hypothetical protein